jgi:hypothetical protein
MVLVNIRQNRNHVEMRGSGIDATYDVAGLDLPPLTDFSFAVWHLLTKAMQTGEPIHIDGPVDPVVIANAERISRIWEMWQPSSLRQVRVTASEEAVPAEPAKGEVVFYSGGVDSTHLLVSLQDSPDKVALTVQGFDYDIANTEGFSALLALTAPLLVQQKRERITLHTNVNAISRGRISWGLSLAGCAFLLSGLFSKALAAADFTPAQDFVSFPWGSNHITNRYLAGTSFRLETMFAEASRCDKVRALAANPLALQSLSFCTKRNMRPRNCGRCAKCLRTKAMFAVATGTVPDIFLDPAFDSAAIDSFDLRANSDRAFFIDLYQEARATGALERYPALQRKFERDVVGPKHAFLSLFQKRRRHS